MSRRKLKREPYGFLDAYLRYERAREHLADLHSLVAAFTSDPQEVWADEERYFLEDLYSYSERAVERFPIPFAIPVRVGEMLYNLRCALDYLVFALAWHDTGTEPTGKWAKSLQFPIESKPKEFERRRATRLEGVSNPHVAMIREYQLARDATGRGFLRP
ncbi:MAG: hypothetical protein LC808_32810 [Actinobacteria bacterium]|nr:hypothetical protein [Actinomycetota bacterium]